MPQLFSLFSEQVLIISVEITKTIDEREMQKPATKNKQRKKGAMGLEAIVEGWELNDFVVHLS